MKINVKTPKGNEITVDLDTKTITNDKIGTLGYSNGGITSYEGERVYLLKTPKGSVFITEADGHKLVIAERAPTTPEQQRQALVSNISSAYYDLDYAREQDYNNDIGFRESAQSEKEIEAAQQALKEFDAANPELAAKVAAQKAAETERKTQSAKNA